MSEEKKITRRNFLRAAGLVGGAAAVAACAAPAPAPAPHRAPRPQQRRPRRQPQPRTAAPVVGKPFDGKTLKMHAISGGNYEELYKLIPAWEEKTGAKVEFVFKGNGFETDKRLVQDMSAGTVDYDVCWDHSSFFSQYVKLDGLEPIDNYFSAEDLQDFIPRLVDATKTDGHIWVMPRHFDISCMHYRTDLGIAKAPETWDEFKQMRSTSPRTTRASTAPSSPARKRR